MSTLAATPDSRAGSAGLPLSLASARVRSGVAAAGIAIALGSGLLVATSDHLRHPVEYGIELAVLVAGTVAASLYWAVHRPGNRIASWLLVYAASFAGVGLQGASSPVLHSVGVLFDVPSFLLGFVLLFAFPGGRVAGALERVVLAAIVAIALATFLPWFFFSPVVSGGAPLAGCNAACPENALMIANRPGIASGFGTSESTMEVLVALAVVILLAYRLASASAPRRRASLSVYVPALLLVIPFAIFHAADSGLFDLAPGTTGTIGWFVTTGRVLFTFGFVLAIWQAMLLAGVAMKEIMSRLGSHDEPRHLRRLVAEALDDPRLELSFQVDREARLFVDSAGRPADPTRPGAGQVLTPLERNGETVAYVAHDPALESDPELMQAAGQAVLLALETGRLAAELSAKTVELRNSSGRIVAAGEAERRRIERDLHDGAQQRLMAIQIKLALLRDTVGEPEVVSRLDEISADAAAAVDELRRIAHGIYPAVLRERGLGDGLRAWARTAPIPVEIANSAIGRFTPAVEAAVYFCSLEAIQNAIKHAGTDARVRVALARRGGELWFEVVDDGAGFEPDGRTKGMGLRSMRDRVEALGGELTIRSGAGRGTSVAGVVPI